MFIAPGLKLLLSSVRERHVYGGGVPLLTELRIYKGMSAINIWLLTELRAGALARRAA